MSLKPSLNSRNSLLGTDSAVMASYLLHSHPGTGTEILVLPALRTALAVEVLSVCRIRSSACRSRFSS